MPSSTGRVVSVSLQEGSSPEGVVVFIRTTDDQTLTWNMPLAQAPDVGASANLSVTFVSVRGGA